jgi:hypothetical protein
MRSTFFMSAANACDEAQASNADRSTARKRRKADEVDMAGADEEGRAKRARETLILQSMAFAARERRRTEEIIQEETSWNSPTRSRS